MKVLAIIAGIYVCVYVDIRRSTAPAAGNRSGELPARWRKKVNSAATLIGTSSQPERPASLDTHSTMKDSNMGASFVPGYTYDGYHTQQTTKPYHRVQSPELLWNSPTAYHSQHELNSVAMGRGSALSRCRWWLGDVNEYGKPGIKLGISPELCSIHFTPAHATGGNALQNHRIRKQ